MNIRNASEAGGRIHEANCDIWQVPDQNGSDALIDAGYQDDAFIAYLSAVSPIYAAFSRILAQFSGILLLAMTDDRTVLGLDRAVYVTARDQLNEAHARLQDIAAPPGCARHRDALGQIAAGLDRAAAELDIIAALRDPRHRKTRVADVVLVLKHVQRRLIATAEPDANIAPVDFQGGCCSCGALAVAPDSSTTTGRT